MFLAIGVQLIRMLIVAGGWLSVVSFAQQPTPHYLQPTSTAVFVCYYDIPTTQISPLNTIQ